MGIKAKKKTADSQTKDTWSFFSILNCLPSRCRKANERFWLPNNGSCCCVRAVHYYELPMCPGCRSDGIGRSDFGWWSVAGHFVGPMSNWWFDTFLRRIGTYRAEFGDSFCHLSALLSTPYGPPDRLAGSASDILALTFPLAFVVRCRSSGIDKTMDSHRDNESTPVNHSLAQSSLVLNITEWDPFREASIHIQLDLFSSL